MFQQINMKVELVTGSSWEPEKNKNIGAFEWKSPQSFLKDNPASA